ncbi:MAG: zinc ribbon domain-containing protein [Dokdonella sp.]
MPIYEFECTACGNIFERLQKLSDADPTDCPDCGKHKVKRRLTAPAFRLAGSGWYETDFKKEGEKKHNLADNHERPKAETGNDAGGEADPAPKPAAKAAEPAPAPKPATGGSSAD